VTRAFDETWELNEREKKGMRLSAYGLAVKRVAEATTTRGIYP
jgi:glutamate dehydrogenase/leucine dehydrogenase